MTHNVAVFEQPAHHRCKYNGLSLKSKR